MIAAAYVFAHHWYAGPVVIAVLIAYVGLQVLALKRWAS